MFAGVKDMSPAMSVEPSRCANHVQVVSTATGTERTS
jgi:hypothetical protein